MVARTESEQGALASKLGLQMGFRMAPSGVEMRPETSSRRTLVSLPRGRSQNDFEALVRGFIWAMAAPGVCPKLGHAFIPLAPDVQLAQATPLLLLLATGATM